MGRGGNSKLLPQLSWLHGPKVSKWPNTSTYGKWIRITTSMTCVCHVNVIISKFFYLYNTTQEAPLSPRDRAMRRVNWNLANCHATVQKLLIRQVLTKSMVWSWRFSRRQCVIDNVHSTMMWPSRFHCLRCVINKPTTDDLWISPVYRRLAVAKFSKSTM